MPRHNRNGRGHRYQADRMLDSTGDHDRRPPRTPAPVATPDSPRSSPSARRSASKSATDHEDNSDTIGPLIDARH